MATEVDISSVFDTVLPNVYIKKVTLTPSTLAGSRRGIEYDPGASDQLEKNQFGKFQPNPASVDFDNIPRGSNGLVVTVDLVLKDLYGQSGKSFWYEREDVLKYLNLRVVLSKRKDLTEDLINGDFRPSYLRSIKRTRRFEENIINLQKVRESSLMEEARVMTDGRTTFDIIYTTSFYLPNSSPKNIAVFAHVFQDLNEVLRDNNIISRSRRRKYIQGNSVGQHIVLDSQLVDNAFVYKLPNGKVWAGPIHLGPDGQFMAGAFHTQDRHSTLAPAKVSNFLIEDYRVLETLAAPELMLHPVRPKQGPSGFIRTSEDLRVVRSKAYISEPIYSVTPENIVKFAFHVNHENIIKENTQYGAILDTADKKARTRILNNCRIKDFSVYRERVERGLKRGKVKTVDYENRTELIANSSEQNAGFLLEAVTERSLLTNSELSRNVQVGAIKEVYLTPIADSGVRTFGVTDYDMARETDGLYRYKIELEFEDGTVAFVKDQLSQLAEAKRDMEEYFNEASVEGNYIPSSGKLSPSFISTQQSRYPIPSREEVLNNTPAQNAELLRESLTASPWLNASAKYLDVLSNTSSIKFRELSRAMKILTNLCNPETASLRSIQVLINLMQGLESEISSKIGSLDARMDEVDYQGRTAAYKGKLPRNSFKLVKNFNTIHDSNIQNNVGYNFLGGSSANSTGPRMLTLEQLEDRLNLENDKYFRVPYDQRAETQEQTDDTDPSAADDLDLGPAFFSYLTPARIVLGQKNRLRTVNRKAGLFAKQQYNLMLSEILRIKPQVAATAASLGSKSDPTESDYDLSPVIFLGSGYKDSKTKVTRKIYEENLSNLIVLDSLNVSISSLNSYKTKTTLRDSADGLEIRERKKTNSNSVLGSNVKFSTDRLSKDEIVNSEDLKVIGIEEEKDLTGVANAVINSLIDSEQSVFSAKKKKKVKSIEDLKLSNEDNAIDEYFDNLRNGESKKRKFLRELPNQIKSLMLSLEGQARKDWSEVKSETGLDVVESPEYAGLFYFLYNHINTIEVMVGFETTDGSKAQVSSPRFSRLTPDMFRKIRRENMTVMCRMVPYSNDVLGLKKSKKMRLPEFDTVFMLSPRQSDQIQDGDAQTAVFQTASDFTEPEQREVVASERLVQDSTLNTTGKRLLRQTLTSMVDQDYIPVEFSNTIVIQQPRDVTRAGTTFSSREKVPDQASGNVASTQNRIYRDIQSNPVPEIIPSSEVERTIIRTTPAASSTGPSTMPRERNTGRSNGNGGGY